MYTLQNPQGHSTHYSRFSTQDTERKAIDPNNSRSLSLEVFMAKLCSHHQKQFICVLSNLCTEESVMKSKSRSASVSEIENANTEDYDHCCSDRKANSLAQINKSASESCLSCHVSTNNPADLYVDNYHSGKSHFSHYLSKVPFSSDSKEDHAIIVSPVTNQTVTNNPIGIPTTEEKPGTMFVKISEASQSVFLEHCILLHSNSALNLLNDSPGSELSANNPKIANKENTQYVNPKQTPMDCNDCKLKQESSGTTAMVKKLANFCESPFQNLSDHSGSTLQKVRVHENRRLKTVKCKNSRVLMTNDCDKQCDVVYISEPVTTECHFENHHKSVVCPRNTARKSTRGYLYSGDCCELSTVRTSVKSSKVEDKVNSAMNVAEALIIPNGLNAEKQSVDVDTVNSVPQNEEVGEIPDTSRSNESENYCDQHLDITNEPVNHVSDSSFSVLSDTEGELGKSHVLSNHNEMAFHEHVDEIPKTESNFVVNIDAQEESAAKLAIDADFEVSNSKMSSNKEDNTGIQPLDMGDLLESNHGLSVHDKTPLECYPHNIVTEETNLFLQNSDSCPSTTCSSTLPNWTADEDLLHNGFSSLSTNILLYSSSEEVIADSALSHKDSECPISRSPPVDLGSSDSMIWDHERSVQSVVKVNAHEIKLLENVKNGQSLALEDSVKMEPTEDVVSENIDPIPPLPSERNCPTCDHLRPNEHFHNPLDMCAKLANNNNVRVEENVSNEDLQSDDISPTGCSKNMLKEPLKTKEVNGESNMGAFTLDKIDSSLSCKNATNTLTPSKRHKKVPAPTDRCLRSREALGDSPLKKIPSLQEDTSTIQRFVAFKTEEEQFTITILNTSMEQTSDGKNYFAVSLNSHCREVKPLFHEKMSACSSPFKLPENLKIYYKTGSDKKIVSFTKDNNHNFLNMEDTECKYGAATLRSSCELPLQKSKKSLTENASNFILKTRSSTKHVALKTLKDSMKCSKSDPLKKVPTQNKHTNTFKNRPKFFDWCSEEDNKERISNFNGKYTAIHKSWIPLEREAANMAKCKNKADKLKEIWKTKKRVRKPKSVQDAPQSSPVQMLFMNPFKLTDICKWFMETTETKSLVIVKKLNTRLPEEHQLPIMVSPKYSSQSLYPHILQAQRLKKHLKKFASAYPARNDLKTQNSLIENLNSNSVPLNEVPKDTVLEPTDCEKQEPRVKVKKSAPSHILEKYNKLREDFKYQSRTVNKSKSCMMNKSRSKESHAENAKGVSISKSSSQKIPNSLTSKSVILKNSKSKKRPKNDSLRESIAQPSKKRKIEAKHKLLKNGPHVNKNPVSTKTKAGKIGSTSCSHAPKKEVRKAGICKTSFMKAKAKTPMQKLAMKSQLALKRQTKSAKRRQVPPSSSASSHKKKERHNKICSVSTKSKVNVASQVRQRKPRSRPEPPARKGRSLEYK
ncbi:LOW QUALITY PROTEIN: uncharacterized protein RB166_018029 [Leptodactylus fuscus]